MMNKRVLEMQNRTREIQTILTEWVGGDLEAADLWQGGCSLPVACWRAAVANVLSLKTDIDIDEAAEENAAYVWVIALDTIAHFDESPERDATWDRVNMLCDGINCDVLYNL